MLSEQILKIPLHCERLDAYLMDESLLIHSHKTSQVYGYEKADAALFLQIDEYLCEHTQSETITHFADIECPSLEQMFELATCEESVAEKEYEEVDPPRRVIDDDTPKTFYQVDDNLFAIHYPDKTSQDLIHPLITHLHVQSPTIDTWTMIDLVQYDDLWEVYVDGVMSGSAIPKSQLAAYVQSKMMAVVYQSSPYLMALHAGSVERDGKVIIMPAVAGSGKTTMTAALLHHGSALFSDEITVLDDEGDVRPLPFPMTIKAGSWEVLTPMYPHLEALATHKRFDSQDIRFLMSERMHQGSQRASHLVFPTYSPGAKTSLTPLGATQALARIKEATYQVQDTLDAQKFGLILDRVIALPKYALVYSDLKDAIAVIDTLLERSEEST